MLIAQISDLHFLPKGVLAFGRVDVAGCLERAIDHLNTLRPRPDAVLITGDLTNDGDAAVWGELMEVLRRLEAPIWPLPGNHDDRELMRAACAGLGLFPKAGPLRFAAKLGPLCLIGLDSLIPGDPAGRLGPEQLAWLDARLAEAPEQATLVALHHPPSTPHRRDLDVHALDGRQRDVHGRNALRVVAAPGVDETQADQPASPGGEHPHLGARARGAPRGIHHRHLQ